MITTSVAAFVLEDSAQQRFLLSNIVCEPTYTEASYNYNIRLYVQDSVSGNTVAQGYMSLTATEVSAETGSGSGEHDIWFNALQRAVVTKLLAMTGNASTTFTIV
jgi:hypothetical protein